MKRQRTLIGLISVAALLLLGGRFGASLYADYLWFTALGAAEIWRVRVITTAQLTVASFIVATLFAFVNLYAVRRSVVSLVLPRRIANLEIGEEVPGRYLVAAAAGLAVAMGVLLTLPDDLWYTALLARIGIPFRERDPYFSADLGFFVYWLPFENAMYVWSIIVLVSVTLAVILLYALTPSLRWERGTLHVSAYVRRHFTMLGAVVLLVLAWSYRLSMYRLLSVGGGESGVFSSVDHHRLVPATLLLAVVTLGAAAIVAWAGWTGQARISFLAVTAVLVLSLVSRTVAPLMFRRSVDPAERRNIELPYMATRLAYTRVAYGVDRMRPELLGTGFGSASEAAASTSVWDGSLLMRVAERSRHARVVGSGAAWSATPNSIAASLVERTGDGAFDGRDVWNVTRFDPTRADERGLPHRAPANGFDDLALGEPAVYDGGPAYGVLSDSNRQLAGVEMVSTRSRLIHAWSLQNFRLLFGSVPPNRPAMVERRDVRERVETLLPFFVQGADVVPLIADDTLYWVVELYAASATYPLSQRFMVLGAERSYFVHAATAVVQASSGRVRLIPTGNPDPVAMSWLGYFPRLTRAGSSLPPAVLNALPPETDGAHAQAAAFAVAGFRGDSLEVRHFAGSDFDSVAQREPARAALPAAGGVAVLWPLLDSTERVRGVVSASGGAQRITSWIPLVGASQRWATVAERMRMADSSGRDNTGQRGAMRVVPLRGEPLYVQPTFLLRPGAAPLLQRVSTVMRDTVRVATTLEGALGSLAAAHLGDSANTGSQRDHADSLYAVMRDALRRGDWVAFGHAFDALGVALHARRR